MAVVANISVLLSARIEGYRSQIGFARQDNESFARSAAQAGLKIRDAGKAMDILRQRSFDQLSTQQKLNEEIRAINHLFKAGIIDQGNYAKAMVQLNEAYRQKAALEAAKAQESLNNSIQRGTQIMRPQIAVQKEALAEYKRTALALRELEQSGTAKKLGITSEEIENRRREAFLTGQAKFQGKETPAQIQERTAQATAAATEAVTKFNARFQTARQRLSETIAVLRDMRSQAELAAKPLDIRAQQEFVRKAIEDFRRDSGLDEKLKREAKAQEESNKAVQRGIQLLDKNYAARQRLGNQLRDLQAAAKSDPDRFGGQKLEEARQKAFQEYRNETQSSTQLAAASVDKFNEKFVTAKQRLRDTINELRVMRQNAAEAGKVLDANAQKQFIRKAVDTYRRDSGLDDQLSEQAVAREAANKAAERGIQLVDKELVANGRRRQQLMQQLADINAAREAYKGLDVRKFASATAGIFDELNALRDGRESPAAIAERKAQELAANKARIEKENIAAIKATMTAEQARATEYAKINQDIVDGLSQEAAARRRLAVDSEFNKRTGVDQRLQIEADLVQKYNESIARGTQIARPAKAATDEYRQTVKDLGRALNAAKINQQEYNVARLQATRLRQDASISPILQSGINQVAPYKQVLKEVTRSMFDMRAAVSSGLVTQKEYNQAMAGGNSPAMQLAKVQEVLVRRLRAGKITLDEYRSSMRQANQMISTQESLLSRLTRTFGVFRTVFIGMASAQIYGGIFEGISAGFEFEPQIRRSIALFGELDEAKKKALRDVVINSTFNNVPIVERAKVLEELAKDGVSADVAIRTLAKTLEFASVSGLAAQDAVSKVSEVMSAFRENTGTAEERTAKLVQIMDLLQFASTQTASNVEEVAEALIRTAPQANQLGIELREATKGVIGLSNIGRKSDVGGNELAIALRDLTIKAVENKEAWESLGLTVFDQDGTYAGMSVTIRQLANLLSSLSSKQQVMTLQTLGVTQKASQFQQQLVALIDEIDNAKTAFDDTNGSVERIHKDSLTQLEIMLNNVSTAWSVLINSSIVAWLEDVATWVNKNREATQFWGTMFVGVMTGLVVAFNAYRVAAAAAMATTVTFKALTGGPKAWLEMLAGVVAATVAIGLTTAALEGMNVAADAAAGEVQDLTQKFDMLEQAQKKIQRSPLEEAQFDRTNQTENIFNAFFRDQDLYNEFERTALPVLNDINDLIAKSTVRDLNNAKPLFDALYGDERQWRRGSDLMRSLQNTDTTEYFEELREKMINVKLALQGLYDDKVADAVSEYESIVSGLRTPVEEALDQLSRLGQVRKIGIDVSPVVERRQIDSVLESLQSEFEDKQVQARIRINSAAELRGSSQEFSSRVSVRLQESERDERRNQFSVTLKELREQNATLAQVLEALNGIRDQESFDEQLKLDEF
ncbi:MAG: phage tail tape measure protein [Planctomycetaceae bacterium]|nr:phage tail tape measure protein [Planctomycetaceae bacterium]